MQYILTDIEGTTTSAGFVYDILFPYFIDHIQAFAAIHRNDAALAAQLADVQKTVQQEEGIQLSAEETIEQLIAWTRADRKHTAMKNIQGMVWQSGYEKGTLESHIYADVLPAFTAWQQQQTGIGIYSSGSVKAQQLLFRYTVQGDLSVFISHYFDTRVGNKRDITSYQNIQQQLQIPSPEILFLSDTETELDAAAAAGFATLQIVREGHQSGTRHQHAPDLSAIIPLPC